MLAKTIVARQPTTKRTHKISYRAFCLYCIKYRKLSPAEEPLKAVKMHPKSKKVSRNFVLRSANPASSLQFSNKELHYFVVTIETPSLQASKTISTYDYGPTDGFGEYFVDLAEQQKPWRDVKFWEPLEKEMSLMATCSAVGQVTIRVVLQDEYSEADRWSLECALVFDFGILPRFANDARRFYALQQ